MITIENIQKKYGNNVVLSIGHLDIKAGECFGLVGNNGAGKTTLFSLILDLIKPTTGAVNSKSVNVAASEDWKNYTGSYLDEGFLIDFLTPDEYFKFIGKIHGLNQVDISRLRQSQGHKGSRVAACRLRTTPRNLELEAC